MVSMCSGVSLSMVLLVISCYVFCSVYSVNVMGSYVKVKCSVNSRFGWCVCYGCYISVCVVNSSVSGVLVS